MGRSRNRLEVALSPKQLETLTIESERTGTPRAALLRQWAFTENEPPAKEPEQPTVHRLPQGPRVYSKAVEAACQSYSGLPRAQMESIVSAVIISLNDQ